MTLIVATALFCFLKHVPGKKKLSLVLPYNHVCKKAMNLQLINPFAHENFPEHVDVSIDTNAQCVRFNNGNSRFAGSFIAIGRTEGVVAILDIETRAYLRFLVGHVKAVTTLW